ncbi:MAG TPA: hypothetical protein VN626_10940 [Clostridia bacterium]|nr:hypothetical protein [Clostridia bacterium]
MFRKAEDEVGLTPAKDSNAARRKIDGKDNPYFKLFDYIIYIPQGAVIMMKARR